MKIPYKRIIIYKKLFLGLLFLVSGFFYQCSRMEDLGKERITESSFAVLKDGTDIYQGASGTDKTWKTTQENSESKSTEHLKSKSQDEVDLKSETMSEAKIVKDASEVVICVHVAGAVKKPGIYYLQEDSRIMDAIVAAGGFLEEAREDYLNLAKIMQDEQKIYVPSKNEDLNEALRYVANDVQGSASSYTQEDEQSLGKIDINTANQKELMSLFGIGEKRAEDIINYRREHGNFQSIEEIKKVPGIKENAFEKIKDTIVVR